MARLTRVATWRTHRIAGIVAVTALLAGACGDDDDQGAAPDDTVPASITTTTREVNFGGLEIPEIPGTFPAGLPSIGFGIAVPQGWQATVLTEEALERLRDATLNQPSFLDAAETVAASGAVFYAAGVDADGRVGELKVDVQDATDTSPDSVAALATAVADTDGLFDVQVVDDPDSGRVRVDYRFRAESADGDGTIESFGSQLFVPDGDRLWSFIVTSEDQASQDALLAIFAASITFCPADGELATCSRSSSAAPTTVP